MGGAFASGLGFNQQQYQNATQQPVAPPSETEILIALLNANVPVERWICTPGFQNFVQMLSNIVTLSVVGFFREAKFNFDEESGTFMLDTADLPTHLQTVSEENVVSEFNALLASSDSMKKESEMSQSQIMAFAEQNLMQSALGAALDNPGVMQKGGQFVGSLARGIITGGRA
jgi:hypothetical protein